MSVAGNRTMVATPELIEQAEATLGLSASFFDQVLELPELRAKLSEIVPGVNHPQMVLRIGIPSDPIAHAAPRRAVDDVLEIVTDH